MIKITGWSIRPQTCFCWLHNKSFALHCGWTLNLISTNCVPQPDGSPCTEIFADVINGSPHSYWPGGWAWRGMSHRRCPPAWRQSRRHCSRPCSSSKPPSTAASWIIWKEKELKLNHFSHPKNYLTSNSRYFSASGFQMVLYSVNIAQKPLKLLLLPKLLS